MTDNLAALLAFAALVGGFAWAASPGVGLIVGGALVLVCLAVKRLTGRDAPPREENEEGG